MASLSPSSTTVTPPPLPGLAASTPLGPLDCPPTIATAWSTFLPPNLLFVSPLELGKMRARAHRNPYSQIQEEEEEVTYLTGGTTIEAHHRCQREGREGGAACVLFTSRRCHVRHLGRGRRENPPPPLEGRGGATPGRNRVGHMGKETCSGEHACELG
jgi:hypothetical protein